MPTFDLYNSKGEKIGTVEQPAFFQTEVDEKLIHRYFVWVRSLLRHTVAHTKTRGQVSGGGKKPWKQKGTGRARSGSSRNPIWRHGGTVFGPNKDQTFATRMPRQERRKAFFGALSAKAIINNVLVLDSWTIETPKTKDALKLLAALPLADKKILHIQPEYNHGVFASLRNIPGVTCTTVQELNVIDVLNHDVLLLTKDTVQALEKHFTPAV
jgi:large subunit ribosomal protein L4